ncbi:hypothetical protein Cni_G10234 [Canna indica]|uniref:UspA domain-containing protein n=1 Tax=Canna indica TaxID=4628 RepID=A0AAQ3K7D8_9LILI|nr:hypothetical protein Cni_G10234 [Canna indica]
MSCKRGSDSGREKRRAKTDGKEEGTGKKRIMVLLDRSARAKNAMIWALTHVANRGDVLTLLLVLPPHCCSSSVRKEEDEAAASHLISSLASICKTTRPQALPHPSAFIIRS